MKEHIKLVIDSAIPFIQGIFEPYATVVYKKGSEINSEDLKDAQGMIIRTRTVCNESLLKNSQIKIIATATIGKDHIDQKWCEEKGITVTSAPGCNAGGVMQYVFCSLYGVASRNSISLQDKTLGIIGVGHTGGRVASMASALGFKILKNDPPREREEGSFEFCPLDMLLENSDIVTMHVPLDETTRLMADDNFFKKMKKGAIFINTSRGEVVDEKALKKNINKLGATIIDVWQNEPHIDKDLLDKVSIATPHIAGYTYQGKQNGTAAGVRSIARYFGFLELADYYPSVEKPENEAVKINLRGLNQGEITSILQYNYPVFTDDFMFRLDPDKFEELRSDYNYRREIYTD